MPRAFYLFAVVFTVLIFLFLAIQPTVAQPPIQGPLQEGEPKITPQPTAAQPPPQEPQPEGQSKETTESTQTQLEVDWASVEMESEGNDSFPHVLTPIPLVPSVPEVAAPESAASEEAAPEEAAPAPSDPERAPAQLSDDMVPAPMIGELTHVVQAGETLYRIAQRYGISLSQLIAANNIQNPQRLQIGQVLTIPALESNVQVTVATPQEGETQPTDNIYRVQRGDSPYEIAKRFGVSVEALMAVNQISDPRRLNVGQVLTIPKNGEAPIVIEAPNPATVVETPIPTTVIETPIPTAVAVEPLAPGNTNQYVVQRGDKPYEIAQRFGVSVEALMAVNQISDPRRLKVGQVLTIPNKGEAPIVTEAPNPITVVETPIPTAVAETPIPTAVAAESTALDSTDQYVVQRGDNLSRIARRFGVTVQAMIDANNLPDPDRINAGQTLTIPKTIANSPPETPTAAQTEAPPAPSPTQATAEVTINQLEGEYPFIWPIPAQDGWLVKWYRAGHPGIDIILPIGTPIRATADGIVEFSGWNAYGFGNLVVIDHGNGYRSLYGHQSERLVVEGDTVTQGDVIGLVGITGRATHPHLHFEIRQAYTPVNPCDYLPGGCQP